MTIEDEVKGALRSVIDPEIGEPIEDLGMLGPIRIAGGIVEVTVLLTVEGCPMRETIAHDVTSAISALPGVDEVRVSLNPMSDEQRAALTDRLRAEAPGPQIVFADTNVVAVASGKGGVGKSSVAVNLAAALAADGLRVGILDADVWGFSVPRMMGLDGEQPAGFEGMVLPLEAHGVKVISMGFFVPEETPVVWRGPMLHKALEQFLTDVRWGDLDLLLCDLPPGTGDISISLASFLPEASMIVVTTPQEAARKVAERAGRMAERAGLETIGVIENMSYFLCPGCGAETRIFGDGGGAEAADSLGVPLLGRVPLVPAIREGSDAGTPVVIGDPHSAAAAALRTAAGEVMRLSEARRPPRAAATAADVFTPVAPMAYPPSEREG